MHFSAFKGRDRALTPSAIAGLALNALLCRVSPGAVKPNKSVIGQDSIA
nr:hypothetical protein [Serratia marcescens]